MECRCFHRFPEIAHSTRMPRIVWNDRMELGTLNVIASCRPFHKCLERNQNPHFQKLGKAYRFACFRVKKNAYLLLSKNRSSANMCVRNGLTPCIPNKTLVNF